MSKFTVILGESRVTERRSSRWIRVEKFRLKLSVVIKRERVRGRSKDKPENNPIVFDKSELRARCRIVRAWDARVTGIGAKQAATTQESTRLRDQFHAV